MQRQLAFGVCVALALVAALVVTDFHENVVLFWAAVTTVVATSVR